jgi:hypothetical protein
MHQNNKEEVIVVFAIVVSICLAFGGDPTKIVIAQARMRDCLMKFFSEKMLTMM